MKERPILFSGEMVRAILGGRKTMTRRIMNPTDRGEKFLFNNPAFHRYKYTRMWEDLHGEYCAYFETGPTEESKYGFAESFKCPFGRPGDRLWVRETFCDRNNNGEQIKPLYRADGQEYEGGDGWHFEAKWKPSIFMPRRYSRITLEITNVRVERLQDISEEDAKSEGANGEKYRGQGFEHCIYREAFRTLWESINAKRGYSWDANPWVWVVEFKRIKE